METVNLMDIIIVAAVAIVGVIVWFNRRGHIEGDPVGYAQAIVEGIEHLWENNRIKEGDRLDDAIHALTNRYKYLDYDSAKVLIEAGVRQLKRRQGE